MNPRLKVIIHAAIVGSVFLGGGMISADPDKILILLRSMIYFLIGLSILSWCIVAMFTEPKRKVMVRFIDLSWSIFSSLAALFAFIAVIESFSENEVKGLWTLSDQQLRFHREVLTEELFSACPDRYQGQVLHPCNEAWFLLSHDANDENMRIAAARNALNSDVKIEFPEGIRGYFQSIANIGKSKEFTTVETFAKANPNGLMFRYLVMIFAALRLSKSLVELWVPKDSRLAEKKQRAKSSP